MPLALHLAAALGGCRSSPGPDLAAEDTNPIRVSALGWKGGLLLRSGRPCRFGVSIDEGGARMPWRQPGSWKPGCSWAEHVARALSGHHDSVGGMLTGVCRSMATLRLSVTQPDDGECWPG